MKASLFLAAFLFVFTFPVFGAAAFAEALDKDNNSVTWTFSFEDGKNVTKAKNSAIQQLKQQGHSNVKVGASTALNQGFFAVLQTAYWVDGVLRNSFVFAFSAKSVDDAKNEAVKELKKLKGWKEDQGYSVNKTGEF
ncbi:hypothetical protein IKP13_04170 [bacterium]|jgi:hypothetical protein|nr:hypothetical protein [bacterium]